MRGLTKINWMDKKLWLWRLHLFKMINLKSLKQTYFSHINKQLKIKMVMFWSLISHFLKIHVILKGYVILLLCIQLRHKYLKSAVTKCEGTQDCSKHPKLWSKPIYGNSEHHTFQAIWLNNGIYNSIWLAVKEYTSC